ncbi:MAG: ATP-binding cassette domain-containing protein [Phycisphaerae bacterium]|nr:ATP-binding cassette domain-containing protein [Phycisphaerae bacterium]
MRKRKKKKREKAVRGQRSASTAGAIPAAGMIAAERAAGTGDGDGLRWLSVVGARQNNLRNITASIPLGRFVCVTGVSGSGKSSLVNDILREALSRELNGATTAQPGAHERIEGDEHLDKIIDIDQTPIGRTPRSNPATYIKVFDEIRALYAKLPDSRVRGYKPGRFSFNVPSGADGGGRCEACEGNGSNRLSMDFLADVWVTCPVCEGRRFNRETLQILFKGKNIADVLDMDVQEALQHFANVPKIEAMLHTLHDVGLDYVKLGQSSTTLSGGEAQRIKLARELVKRSTGRTLYVLDEPTTGLHFEDIRKLLAVLHGFVDAGNTVLVIEHNLDVIKTADWIIDLGPEGGAGGGRIVAEGTPEQVAKSKKSHTGAALREMFEDMSSRRLKPAAQKMRGGPDSVEDSRGLKPAAQKIRGDAITVVGAKQHNLKDITVEIPRGKTTVCCGPSGSGKTSLAVDTLYAEGQRRYVESLSAYARQFLGRMQPPKVEHVHGLSPAICIEQKTATKSPRSTVGTITEIYDYLRILWARIGIPHCPRCEKPVGTQTADEIVERVLGLGEGTKVLLLAPVEPTGQETYEALLRRERANGYARARIDGAIHELDQSIEIDRRRKHRVELVIDRVVVRKKQASRLADSVEQALAVGQGVMIAGVLESDDRAGGELRFSQHRSCQTCGTSFEELTPHHFSFNNALGWCESCEGLGVQQGASASTIVVHPTQSIAAGAIGAWGALTPGTKLHALVGALADHAGFDLHTPWNRMAENHRLAVLHGTGDAWVSVQPPTEEGNKRRRGSGRTDGSAAGNGSAVRFRWRGFFPAIARATQISWQYRKRLEDFVTEVPCEACRGSRLRPDAAAVRLAERTLLNVCSMSLGEALRWIEGLRLSARERHVAGELLHEITSRLRFLVDVGLEYLSLHRSAATLSGGESQRIQLAAQIGTGLTGVLYVLDEPTIGLHPRDNARLVRALGRLRDLGNTLVLVEHDREVIDSADHVLDFGPGAGTFGGEITANGSPRKLRRDRKSLTGAYLSARESIAVPSNRRVVPAEPRTDVVALDEADTATAESKGTTSRKRKTGKGKRTAAGDEAVQWITVRGARENNLQEIDVPFPLGRFTCVTGVSGSGKSTLVSDILYNAAAARIHRARLVPGGHEGISGLEHIDKVINVDQSPIGNSPSSNPATYTGVFDLIRELFAKLPVSRIRGYTPNRFSFNRPGGRCEACEGMGQKCIEMHFLPDVWVECEVCRGKRYTTETLEAQYRGRSIADVLDMRVNEALELFESVPRLRRMLQTLDDVGLGYVQLGQAAPTLSGGEAQRVKLAGELGRPSTGKTLYILDEPTTGLHFDDLKKLLRVLHRLVDLGNTVICIEHNLDVIKTADWVIDLGPEAGDAGGTIVVAGAPERIAATKASHTGKALAPVLEAGPVAAREIFDANQLAAESMDSARPLNLGDDVRMPWDRDGRTWHTADHVDHKGEPVQWDPALLVWLVETMESVEGFAPTDWNHRTRVEIKAPGSVPWFAHLRTSGRDLIDITIRVPNDTFTASDVSKLGIKTLDERRDLPIYGQWDRARLRRGIIGWQDVRLFLRDFQDVNRKTVGAFLRRAAGAYLSHVRKLREDPDAGQPWKTEGINWHLSQKSINPKTRAKWPPSLLMALVGCFKALERTLVFDWNSKVSGSFALPNESKPIGKLVTNMARGIRVELRAPAKVLTPVRIMSLGEDAEVKRSPDYDRVTFWVRSLNQIDTKQLLDVWRVCTAPREDERLRSA